MTAPRDTAALSTADILNRAADLIAPDGAWTQGALARTRNGYAIGPEEDDAVCWCVQGALYRAGGENVWAAGDAHIALKASLGSSVSGWNDAPERTPAEAVAALRAAALASVSA